MAKADKPLTKSAATTQLKRAASKMHSTKAAAKEASAAWADLVFEAYNAGLTYREISVFSDMSRVRVDQVLRSERQKRGIPLNTSA